MTTPPHGLHDALPRHPNVSTVADDRPPEDRWPARQTGAIEPLLRQDRTCTTYVPAKVVPWTSGQRVSVRRELPERYRIAVDLGAGCGLRQGEIFAVSPDDIDPTRPVLHVEWQIKIVRGQCIFAPPKGGKLCEVPLAESVHERLIAHAGRFEPVLVTLPGDTSRGSQGPCRCTWSLRIHALSRPKFNANL